MRCHFKVPKPIGILSVPVIESFHDMELASFLFLRPRSQKYVSHREIANFLRNRHLNVSGSQSLTPAIKSATQNIPMLNKACNMEIRCHYHHRSDIRNTITNNPRESNTRCNNKGSHARQQKYSVSIQRPINNLY